MSRPRNVNPTDPLANQSLHYFAFHPIRHLEVTLNALKRGYPPETALQPKPEPHISFTRVYFPTLLAKGVRHAPEDCCRLCNGNPHRECVVCRFCRGAIAYDFSITQCLDHLAHDCTLKFGQNYYYTPFLDALEYADEAHQLDEVHCLQRPVETWKFPAAEPAARRSAHLQHNHTRPTASYFNAGSLEHFTVDAGNHDHFSEDSDLAQGRKRRSDDESEQREKRSRTDQALDRATASQAPVTGTPEVEEAEELDYPVFAEAFDPETGRELSPRAMVARPLQEESHHDSGFLELTDRHHDADTPEDDGAGDGLLLLDFMVKADEDETESASTEDEKTDLGSNVHLAASRPDQPMKAADMESRRIRSSDRPRTKLDAPRALQALRLLFQPQQPPDREIFDLGDDSDDEQMSSKNNKNKRDGQDAFIELFRAIVAPVLDSLRTRFEITATLRFSTPAEIDASYARTIGRLGELIEETRNIELERCFTRARGARQDTLDDLRAEHARMVKVRASTDRGAAEDGAEGLVDD